MVVLYCVLFLMVFYFTFYLDWLTSSEIERINKASKALEGVQKQFNVIQQISQRPRNGILDEITNQSDCYLPRIKEALEKTDIKTDPHFINTPVKKYEDDLKILHDFFNTSQERLLTWTVYDLAKVEEAIHDWKCMQTSNEDFYANARKNLTYLAKMGLKELNDPSITQLKADLMIADSLFSVPSLLTQNLDCSATDVDSFISNKFQEAIFLCRVKSAGNSIKDVNNLSDELNKRLHALQSPSYGQTFQVPYIGIPMQQDTIFQIGIFVSVAILFIINYYMIQLRAIIQHIWAISHESKDVLADELTQIAYHSHFIPILQRSFLQLHTKTLESAMNSQSNLIAKNSKLTKILILSDCLIRRFTILGSHICFFIIIPLAYCYLSYQFVKQEVGEEASFNYFLIGELLFFILFMIILMVNLLVVEKLYKETIT